MMYDEAFYQPAQIEYGKRECQNRRHLVCDSGNRLSDPDDFEKSFIAAMSKEAQLTNLPYELKMSFGFTKCESPATSMNNMIADADEKMYKKKEASRPVSLER